MLLSVRDVVRACVILSVFVTTAEAATPPAPAHHAKNVILFIADGLRHDSVNVVDAPTMYTLRYKGVHFINSHSLFPTLTTPNASAMATGHYLGDTGDFSNAEYAGYPTFNTGNFGRIVGSPTPFLESDPVLGDLDSHEPSGNFLNEESLLAVARKHGFNTAAIGKLGPAAVQDVGQLNPKDRHFPVPQTVILDDSTGGEGGVPVPPEMQSALTAAGLGTKPTTRVQPTGTVSTPGTLSANVGQQKWFADAATKAVLPAFVRNGRPFVLVYWSRDPDGSQHNNGDSLNKLQPGINGPTSRAGVANADANLKQLLDYVNADPALRDSTDIFITSDHGFATISKHEIDAVGHGTTSYSTQFKYVGVDGQLEVTDGWLPVGFLAIDLAHELGLPLFDPDSQIASSKPDEARYQPIDPAKPTSPASRQHPLQGNALIGGTGNVQNHIDAKVIVTVSGGADLIYIAGQDKATARKIVNFLTRQDYVGAVFVDHALGNIPGALPMSAVALEGTAKMPRPSIVVGFKSFLLKEGDDLSAAMISDTPLQEGQGMHGGLGRECTFNNMAALGPDFQHGFIDRLPVSNADIAPTLAHILGLKLPSKGKLQGRVIEEALLTGSDHGSAGHTVAASVKKPPMASAKASNGVSTKLLYQELHGRRYFDSATLSGARRP